MYFYIAILSGNMTFLSDYTIVYINNLLVHFLLVQLC